MASTSHEAGGRDEEGPRKVLAAEGERVQAGLRVLDAACGPGLYAEELARRGAHVSGFDQSPSMVALSRDRVPQADFRVHDAGEPLDWLADSSMDVILLALALEYIDERIAALREMHRVLKPWGALVLSRMHPTGDWLRHGGSYFDARVIEETWSRGWRVRYWIAPLEQTYAELHEAGFLIERLREPRPAPEAKALDPEEYELLHREPRGLLALRALARKVAIRVPNSGSTIGGRRWLSRKAAQAMTLGRLVGRGLG